MEKANFGQIVSFLFGIANDCLVDERKEKQKLHSQRKWQHSCSQLLCGSVAEDHRDHSLRSDYLPL